MGGLALEATNVLVGMTFLLWLCIAAAGDVVYRKCFNWIVLAGFLLIIIILLTNFEYDFINISVKDRLIGAGSAFVILLIFYSIGMMGAGDVKFATVLGVWVGWSLLLSIWALSCVFAVVHGLVARSNLKYFYVPAVNWSDSHQENRRRFIPYVTYLSLATVVVLMLNK